MNKLNQIKKLLFLLTLTVSFKSFSQFIGYPGSTPPRSNWVHSGGEFYADEFRARVIAHSVVGTTYQLTLGYDNLGGIVAGDWILLMQMIATDTVSKTGSHYAVQVISYDQVTKTLVTTLPPYSVRKNFTPTLWWTPGGQFLQAIAIPMFKKFTLDGGRITCSPFNMTTGGGVVVFYADTLIINGGIFTAARKGLDYEPGWVSYGNGGNGGNGDMVYNGGGANGDLSFPAQYCIDGQVNFVYGTAGGKGDQGLANGQTGFVTVGSPLISYPGTSTFNTNLTMGAYTPVYTTQGAEGGGGGGMGGPGGGSSCSTGTPATAGLAGNVGKAGEHAGFNGRSGGIILLKSKYMYINPSLTGKKIFYVDGETGWNGGNGGEGGLGGTGGKGKTGCCENGNVNLQGYFGGTGGPGRGGQGAEGGVGGRSGNMWLLLANPPVNFNATQMVSVSAGNRGVGGKGGLAKKWGGDGRMDTFPLCPPGKWCKQTKGDSAPTDSGAFTTCNCDLAFCALKKYADDAQNPIPNLIEFFANGVVFGTYNINTGILLVEEGNKTYKCVMFDQFDCQEIFQKMANSNTLFNTRPDFTPTGNCNLPNIKWYDYKSNFLNEWDAYRQCLEDYTVPRGLRCYAGICTVNEDDIVWPMVGYDGPEPPATPSGSIGGPNPNFKMDVPAPGPMPLSTGTANTFRCRLIPNPVANELFMDWNGDIPKTITFTSNTAQVVLIKDLSGAQNQSTVLDISALSTGMYWVTLHNSKNSVIFKQSILKL